MTRERIAPTRSDHLMGPQTETEYREDHPAFAMIGANRVTNMGGPGSGATLFGSDFTHGNYVVITIKRASMERSLSSDRFFGSHRMPIAQVAIPESGWATFVSAMNVGDGVPATLLYTETDGEVPGILQATNRREQVKAEVDETLTEVLQSLDELANDDRLNKANREKARYAAQNLRSNLPFVQERFDEHTQETVEKAKREVAAYVDMSLRRAGMDALAAQAGASVLALDTGEATDGD